MRSWLACILVFFVSAPLLAQTAGTQTTTTTTTTQQKKTARKRAPATKRPTKASELQTLREAVSAQQQQIQMLRDEIQKRDSEMQQMQQQLNTLQSTAQQAQSTAQGAASASKQNEDALAALKTNVGKVEATATSTATGLAGQEKRVKALESPTALKYKGITITPGGFISANLNWRKNNQNLDNFGSFGAIPFEGSSQSHLQELRLTARYSRLSLLAQGKAANMNIQGYYEMDFEGAAQTANEVQTNSFQPRVRQAWVNVDAPHGVSFMGGQAWSLLTSSRSNFGPRGVFLPSHISASIMVGFHYTRQSGFRVYKTWDRGDKKKLYLGFAVENPEFTTAGSLPAGLTIWGPQNRPVVSPGGAANCAPDRTTAGLAPCSTFATGLAVDSAPDVIGKIGIDPGWGHFEIAGIVRFFRDRVALTTNAGNSNAGANHTSEGGGVSINGIVPIIPKKVEFQFATLFGRGIGRYGTTGIPDTVYRPDGTLVGVPAAVGWAGIETHPTSNLSVYIYAGDEYAKRVTYYTGVGTNGLPTGLGFGLISQNLTGCTIEIPLTGQACAASNKNVLEIAPGFWYDFYKGPAGKLSFGTFYSYYRRTPWAGLITATPVTVGAPLAQQHEILSALRWYFP